MGGQQTKLSRDRESQPRKAKETHDHYRQCFARWEEDPDFISHLLCENENFGKNLVLQFPNARKSYEDFVEMVLYVRKYDPPIERNAMAKHNIKHTTILDRFLMICLGMSDPGKLLSTKLDYEAKEKLVLEYMKLFIPDPRPGFLERVCVFISNDSKAHTSVKEFSSTIREYLPHAQKHLKDYFMSKFRDLQKDGHLLKHFPSKILVEDAVILSMKIHQLAQKEIKLLYSTETHGLSFHSLEKQILGYTGHWLVLVEHYEKEEKAIYKFGAYQSGPISDVNSFQGNLEGFLFSISPKIRFMTTDKGDNGQHYFYINSMDEKLSKMRKGIGFGGNKHKEDFKLWLDEDLDKSTVHNGNDATYGFGTLASLSTSTLSVRKMEVWGLGSLHDLSNQQEYWKQRYEEIMKRRKVNKKDLIDGSAGLIFEKTFAHRDQVYGEIERKKDDQEK